MSLGCFSGIYFIAENLFAQLRTRKQAGENFYA